MKHKKVALWLAPVSACLLTGCMTGYNASMNGNVSCNGGGSICWLSSSRSSDPNVGIFFTGSGCGKICNIGHSCDGRVEALVAYQEPSPTPPAQDQVKKRMKLKRRQVEAMCVEATPQATSAQRVAGGGGRTGA